MNKAVWVIVAAVVMIGCIAGGSWALASAIGKFGPDAIMAPLRAMWLFKPFTFLVIAGAVALVWFSTRKESLWYLTPVALIALGGWWLWPRRFLW